MGSTSSEFPSYSLLWIHLELLCSCFHLPMQEMWEAWVQPLGWEDSPGGGNGKPLQYSCLEIPGTEEPGGLEPTRLQRVGHDWATEHILASYVLESSVFWEHPVFWQRLVSLGSIISSYDSLLVHSFPKQLLNIYYVPTTLLGTGIYQGTKRQNDSYYRNSILA